jgi:hypothetical protein
MDVGRPAAPKAALAPGLRMPRLARVRAQVRVQGQVRVPARQR